MESNNRCHPIAQWKRRCEQSRRSWCGARARWARLGTIRGNWGLGRGRWKIGGGVKQKKDSGREGGKEQWPTINNRYGWVMSDMNKLCHIWMSHVSYEWIMSRMNESCDIWMSHVAYSWVMSHVCTSCHTWMGLVANISAIGWKRLILQYDLIGSLNCTHSALFQRIWDVGSEG